MSSAPDTKACIFEQAPEFNKYVDATIPLTWTVRWNALGFVLPLLLFSSVVGMETVAFRSWLDDRSLMQSLPELLGIAATPVVMIGVLWEALTRVAHRSARTLKLEEKRITIKPARCERLRWERIKGWQIEPIAGAASLVKLTMTYAVNKNGAALRRWFMVLDKQSQEPAFRRALDSLRQDGVPAPLAVELEAPLESEMRRRPVRGMIPAALAFFLLVHGTPFLLAGLSHSSGREQAASDTSTLTAPEKAKIQAFVGRHFASREQYKRFCTVAGGATTLSGVALYIYALYSIKKGRSEEVGAVAVYGSRTTR